jgi:hypothetical protein
MLLYYHALYCTVLCAAGLQYFRDATSWLSESHVRFGVGVSVDLIKRINELHDLVGLLSPSGTVHHSTV